MNLTITIMAAGEGKRMNSIIPKVLHLFKNKPMLVRIIEECFLINPNKIIIITGKYDKLIKDTLALYIDNFNKLIFIKQINPCGTGDAIKCTLDQYSSNENVLILNGDMPLIKASLIKNFINNSVKAKLLVAKLENPYGYGRILYNNNEKFIGIKEEKDCNDEERKIDIVNVGIYLFDSNILKKYIPLIDNNNIQKEYYLTDIVKILYKETDIEINTYLIEDNLKYQIYGVNTQEELKILENNKELI